MTFVFIPKETLLIKGREAGSPDWHIAHCCASADIHIDRSELYGKDHIYYNIFS